MIYMVEHVFDGPAMEAEWNTWYQQNILNLLTVPGITTAQRFKIENTSPPRYMAMYTVNSTDPFESAAYRAVGGGGNASVRFRPAYKYWRRNLFESPLPAPAVSGGLALLVVDRKDNSDAHFAWMTRVTPPQSWVMMAGLPQLPPFRGLSVVSAEGRTDGVSPPADATVYAPLTEQLHPRSLQR